MMSFGTNVREDDRPLRRFPYGGRSSIRFWRGLAKLSVATAALCGECQASAQARTDDNAVTQAEDAFGFSVGRETIGIYSPGNARGFSPTAAGNLRINGLYCDPVFKSLADTDSCHNVSRATPPKNS